MKISYNWLKEFIDFDLSAEKVAEILTNAGLPVEEIEYLGQDIENVVVGEVIEVGPHPNANKLRLCVVTDGKSKYPVVCGAPNVEVNHKFPFALIGAKLPGGIKIESRALRGVESQGMLCSTTELSLEEGKSDGIMLLPDDVELGTDIRKVLGLDDIVLEIEVTPNRGDCLSHLGVAREIAAAQGLSVMLPKTNFKETKTETSVSVEIKDSFCSRYLGRTIKGVSVNPTPLWMKNRLRNCGIRSINSLVDITNYVLLETGHPLHMFDRRLINGNKIIVRWSKKNEKLLALDGKERFLDVDIPVIADKTKPVALAGIMGGEESAVKDNTVDVFLESAYFDSGTIRQARKKLDSNTESSYRFERETDWENVLFSSRRVTHLVQELCRPQVIEPLIEVATKKYHHQKISLRFSRVNKILGTEIPVKFISEILERLCFTVKPSKNKNKDQVIVTVPSWRNDVKQEIDLIEEVARVYGYDKIPNQANPYRSVIDESGSGNRIKEKVVRDLLIGWGFSEVVNYSFVSSKDLDKLKLSGETDETVLELDNPLSEDFTVLRTNLIMRILKNMEHNFARQMDDIKIFEIGKTFFKKSGEVIEKSVLAGAMAGNENRKHWSLTEKTVDFYSLSGMIESMLKFFKVDKFEFVPSNKNYLSSGVSFDIIVQNKIIGHFGELHPEISGNCKFMQKIYLFELMLDELFPIFMLDKKYSSIPIYPYIRRDLSFIVPENVSYNQIEKLVLQTGGKQLKECSLFDVYQGKNIDPGLRSITCSVIYQSSETTLTNEEVDRYQDKIIKVLEEKLGAKLRVKV